MAEIRHVVLLLLENHSFDQMLGAFPEVDGAKPENYNVDSDGTKYYQIPTTEKQNRFDPKHELEYVAEQLKDNNGGFVRDFSRVYPKSGPQDRQEIMGYYPENFLPGLHSVAADFTVCDRWFSSLPGPTWPNRFFALSGTSNGRVRMPQGIHDPQLKQFFLQTQDTIFDRLNEAGKSWKVYFYDFPASLILTHQRRPQNLAGYSRIENLYKDVLQDNTFPAFVFIEPKYFGQDQNDDHPPHNVIKAEKLIADVYNAIRSSPIWNSTVLIVYFDEHGGFYDHVPPGAATPPDDHREEYSFDRYGVRVPAIVVSPWASRRTTNTVFDHTSVLKYVQDLWNLGPLGNRTAAANSIALCLNEATPRSDTIPFIRVAYTDLIPTNPEWEKRDTSGHHEALSAFAYFLATEKETAMPAALSAVAKGASWWVKAKATAGEWVMSFGQAMMSDLEAFDQRKSKLLLDQITTKLRERL